jgi:hypothetical protein
MNAEMKSEGEAGGAVAVAGKEKPEGFDFTPIRDDVHKLLANVTNQLERQWPHRYSQVGSRQMVLLQLVRLAVLNYKTIALVCSDLNHGAVRDRASVTLSHFQCQPKVEKFGTSAGHAQCFLSVFGIITSYFRPGRHLHTAGGYREVMKVEVRHLERGDWRSSTSLKSGIIDRSDEEARGCKKFCVNGHR